MNLGKDGKGHGQGRDERKWKEMRGQYVKGKKVSKSACSKLTSWMCVMSTVL